jgi:orotidine-5'-phosphate decarboxylase
MTRFSLALNGAVDRTGACLCVGLDPFDDKIPAVFGPRSDGAARVTRFCEAILQEAVPFAAAVKPQLGLFEAYGAPGYEAAMRIAQQAKAMGFVVILDAKRGDIGTTAEGYAAACLGPDRFNADCVTVNPYMGLDTLEPFLNTAQRAGKGVAVLVRTSNPGARDFQDLAVDGAPLWVRVGEALRPAMALLSGDGQWSDLMVVAGATYPAEAQRLREILPQALFLVPGYGAQGASAADAMAGLVQGRGGVVSASRSVLYPPAALEAPDIRAWRATIRAAMQLAHRDLALRA